jgi:predicted lactoylglutathione lyase
MAKEIYLNIPVKDLNKTVEFFTRLGFTFNPQFTDETATCMIVSDSIFVMLITEKRFTDFTNKTIIDAHRNVEMITALSVDSRGQVDEMVNKALEAGATEPKPSQDYGWMYYRQFHDLDGHAWEILHVDPTKIPQQ